MQKELIKGGEFLIHTQSEMQIFTPEEFNEEQNMMAQATQDFINLEIFPHIDKMEKQEGDFVPSLLKKAGELGLLGVSLPEEYGGLGMNFNTSMLIADVMGAAGSFSTTFGAHTGIGTLPILYYGTEEQKQKYLPKLASGEWAACYCLTEPNAGSDANSGKTKAVLNAEGTHYLITGQKMWISNAGFADLFIVFAKIDDDKNLTAFIVEKDFGGITMNPEEHKMGIKGSSTRQVFFNECPVPVENMLSSRQNGFKIAVNILNIGRIKLGVGVIGGCKYVLNKSIEYANQRQQFGTTIANFGAIKSKIANMATRIYATQSASYRIGQMIDDMQVELENHGMPLNEAKLKAVEQYAIECAIMKVHGSEVLDYCTDEGVQIFGGMGFSADAPMERCYRDARIARIYEGTNEINRMLIVGMTMKRAMKGELNLMPIIKEISKELMSIPNLNASKDITALNPELESLEQVKKLVLLLAGKAVQTFGTKLEQEQEVLMMLADMMIEIYVAESTLLRTKKTMNSEWNPGVEIKINMAQLYYFEALQKIKNLAHECLAAISVGDEQKVLAMGIKRFTKMDAINTVYLRREIADHFVKANSFYL